MELDEQTKKAIDLARSQGADKDELKETFKAQGWFDHNAEDLLETYGGASRRVFEANRASCITQPPPEPSRPLGTINLRPIPRSMCLLPKHFLPIQYRPSKKRLQQISYSTLS